jgi:mRNA-degrading endonuclease RelE of RelBE toxin-antitoxin system
MSYKLLVTSVFKKSAKRLTKKYHSFKSDLESIFRLIQENPHSGISIGESCYKIRFSIDSKKKGKFGGARMITYVIDKNKQVILLDVYDKSEKESISNSEILSIIKTVID